MREAGRPPHARCNKGGLRRSISKSSCAASSVLTSTIGRRTSALSINPLRASQYLAGAGLGSVNSRRVSSAMLCQQARAACAVALLHERPHRGKAFGLKVSRQQDGAVSAVGERVEILRVLAGQYTKARRPPRQEIDRLRAIGAAILHADDVRMSGKLQQCLVVEIDRGAIGDVVEHDRPRGMVGERGEMLHEPALRRPRCSRGSRSDSRRSATPPSRPACPASSRSRPRRGRGRSADSAARPTARRARLSPAAPVPRLRATCPRRRSRRESIRRPGRWRSA